MFQNLTDFKYQRSAEEAIGFHVAYFLLFVAIAVLFGGIAGVVVGEEAAYEAGQKVGQIIAVIASMGLAITVVMAKHLIDDVVYIALCIAAGLCGFFGGALLGFVVVAYLTTRPPGKISPSLPPDTDTSEGDARRGDSPDNEN